jgi:hypothetical protein
MLDISFLQEYNTVWIKSPNQITPTPSLACAGGAEKGGGENKK